MRLTAAAKAVLIAIGVFTILTTAVAATLAGVATADAGTTASAPPELAWFALFVGATTVSLALGLGALVSQIVARGGELDSNALRTVSLRVPDPNSEFGTESTVGE